MKMLELFYWTHLIIVTFIDSNISNASSSTPKIGNLWSAAENMDLFIISEGFGPFFFIVNVVLFSSHCKLFLSFNVELLISFNICELNSTNLTFLGWVSTISSVKTFFCFQFNWLLSIWLLLIAGIEIFLSFTCSTRTILVIINYLFYSLETLRV